MSQAHLDVVNLPLHSRHLIEASAGTGKTFNITRIYLRCLLEKQLTVQQILVMTFTKAATEEIRGRIASTLREAVHYWQKRGQGIDERGDPVLDAIYDRVEPNQALALLQAALLELDDAAVYTIHSFCNTVLSELAFISGAPLELALATDTRSLYLEGCEDFIRKVSHNEQQYNLLADRNWHSPERFFRQFQVLMEFAQQPVIPSEAALESEFAQLKQQLTARFQPLAQDVLILLRNHEALIQDAVIKQDAEREEEWQIIMHWLAEGPLDSIPAVVGKFVHGNRFRGKKEGIAEAKLILESLKQLRSDIDTELKSLHKSQQTLLDKLPVYSVVSDGINFVRNYVAKQKSRLNSVDFNDLIRMLAAQIETPDSPLCQQLRVQFPVALVDEFQDTDADQYHILANIYPSGDATEKQALLMIGDPKQAIYGFRGGDIFTYLQASGQARYRWVMDTNWRSVDTVVEGYNRLFRGADTSQPARDLFDFSIQYEAVRSSPGAKAASQPLSDPEGSRKAITFISAPVDNDAGQSKSESRQHLAQLLTSEILRLLHCARLGNKPVQPADIAILVQTGSEALVVQRALKQAGLPSVYLSNRNSLFASPEASDILMVLNAIWHASDLRLITGILASPLLGINRTRINQLLQDESNQDWDELLVLMSQWRQIWLQRGIMPLILLVLQNHYQPTRGDAERSLTNYQHLAEVLQETAKLYPQPGHLLNWLHRQVLAPELTQEHVQRLESDARLIQIVTQHGSKGLEYPIVFVPFASEYRDPLKSGNSQSEILRFYDPQSASQQMALGASPGITERVKREGDAESMRLLYVAITRASHRCYLGVAESQNSHQSALGKMVQRVEFSDWQSALSEVVNQHTDTMSILTDVNEQYELIAQPDSERLHFESFSRQLKDNWRLYSFSALTRQTAHTNIRHREAEAIAPGQLEAETTQSDQQLRYQLKAGAQSGNLLHDILEVIDFTQPDWANTGTQVAKRYGIEAERFEALFDWLDEILATPVKLAGNNVMTLNGLPRKATLREAEFYFPLKNVNRQNLAAVLQRHRREVCAAPLPVSLEGATLEGMMHGFIDLIFKHDGRFYVADYKSTMMGYKAEDYHPDQLNLNNQQHYYDLQYLIYSVALHRFLQQRVSDYDPAIHFGGVAYFYLRGMSPQHAGQAGIFFHALSADMLKRVEKALTGMVTTAAKVGAK